VAKDLSEAARYFELAADQGNLEGQLSSTALSHRLAAEQGDPVAQVKYARCLELGVGVPVNEFEAARYYKLAADQGHTEMQSSFDRMDREAFEEVSSVTAFCEIQ
jgi:TPR repeat protein